MPSFRIARSLAEAWVRITTEGEATLVPDATIAKPYGWVFFYQSIEFIRDPSNTLAALVGNAPILVDRIDGEIRVLGTARPAEYYLAEYERSLPAARLQMRPETPSW
jgi:hypothetical protein